MFKQVLSISNQQNLWRGFKGLTRRITFFSVYLVLKCKCNYFVCSGCALCCQASAIIICSDSERKLYVTQLTANLSNREFSYARFPAFGSG